MNNVKAIAQKLQLLVSTRRLASIDRSTDPSAVHGFVVCASEAFVLLNYLSHDLYLNGFGIFATSSIERCQRISKTDVFGKAVSMFGLSASSPGAIVLDNWHDVIKSVSKIWEIIIIHLENHDSSVCYIGIVQQLNSDFISLRLISPKGCLEQKRTKFPLQEITKVEFGGRYESALLAMACRK